MEDRKKYYKEYHRKNKAHRKIVRRNYYLNHREEFNARRVKYFNKSTICYFCIDKAELGHHTNYNNPELVIRLCKSCHGKIHQLYPN